MGTQQARTNRAIPQHLISAVGAVALTRSISALIQAISLVILARATTLAEFGSLATAVAILSFISVAMEFGLDSHCSRSIALENYDDASRANWLHLVIGCLATTASLITTVLLISAGLLSIGFVLLPVYVLVERRLSFRINNMIALRFESRAIMPVTAGRVTSLALLTAGLYFSSITPIGLYAITSLVGALMPTFILGRYVSISLIKPTKLLFIRTLHTSFHYWAANMSGQLRTLDVAAINLIGSAATAGLYGLPARALSPLRLLGTSISSIAFPMATRSQTVELRRLNRWTATFGAMAVVATFAFWTFAPDVMATVMGERYRESGNVLRVFLIGISLNILGSVLSSELQGFGESKFVAQVGMLLVVIFFTSLAIGAYSYGAVGAAWGVTLTFAAQLLIFRLRIVRKAHLE